MISLIYTNGLRREHLLLSTDQKELNNLHFTGILGAGMSAIAFYLREMGLLISGSDRLLNSESTKEVQGYLESKGCLIVNQTGEGITEHTDAVVVSTAIEDSNPDISKAKELNIPVFHRSDILAAIVKTKKTIAVAGTSGKSTVTALIYHILQESGFNPGIITGAPLNTLSQKGIFGSAVLGGSDLLVIEADESDGTLVKYEPYISLFLNLSKDHKPISETLELFHILEKRSQFSIKNGDYQELSDLPGSTFGLGVNNDIHPAEYGTNSSGSFLNIENSRVESPYPGDHMVQNLTAAIAVCQKVGVSITKIKKASSTYGGIGRRFDIYRAPKGIRVIDDYAHNPEKINAAISTAQKLSNRVIAIFQPHGFGPTRFLFKELIEVFQKTLRENDQLILMPIYYVGGTVAKDISSKDLAEKINSSFKNVSAPETREEIPGIVAESSLPNDLIISMGARDPSLPLFAKSIVEELEKKYL